MELVPSANTAGAAVLDATDDVAGVVGDISSNVLGTSGSLLPDNTNLSVRATLCPETACSTFFELRPSACKFSSFLLVLVFDSAATDFSVECAILLEGILC